MTAEITRAADAQTVMPMPETDTPTRRRSPLVAYLLQWLTSGVYGLWWLHQTMRDLNAMAGRDIFGVRIVLAIGRSILYSYLPLFCVGFLLGQRLHDTLQFTMVVIMFALGVAWIGGLAYVHVRIARAIANAYDERSLPGKPSPALAGVLFFAWFTALPYLQVKMNRLIPANTGHNPGVEADRDA